MRYGNLLSAGIFATLVLAATSAARADEIPEKYRATVNKGLEYLVKQQQKDGHWGANGDQYPVSMTALAGMALLMEGSTVRDGKYATNIRLCADWLMDRSMKGNQRDGLIGNPDHPTEAGRYMYGHGFGLLFLASVYGDEEDRDRRERLKDILTRAVKYTANAQSTQGGWYYTSKMEGHDQDEGSVTVTQVQALRAARNAGIPVPKDVIKKAQDYLKNSTTERGGVIYSLGRGGFRAPAGGERPALTAAAITCGFGAGDYKSELVKKWYKFCHTAIPIGLGGLALEAEAVDRTGSQKAAIIWARGADSFTSKPRVSRAGDAYELTSAFGDDFSRLLVTGASPFGTLPSPPSTHHVQSLLGGAPKEVACEAFGRAPGVPGLLGSAIGLPPEWTDRGAPADVQTTR